MNQTATDRSGSRRVQNTTHAPMSYESLIAAIVESVFRPFWPPRKQVTRAQALQVFPVQPLCHRLIGALARLEQMQGSSSL